MRIQNVPVLGKVLVILVMLGICVLGATAYTTGKMRVINDTYSDLSDHQALSAILLARASRAVGSTRAGIAELVLASTDADDQRAIRDIKNARADFLTFSDGAIATTTTHATEYTELKTSVLKIVDESCAESIRLGVANEMVKAAAAYMRDCRPVFSELAAKYRVAVDTVVTESKAVNNQTTAITNGTIYLTWALMVGGLVAVLVASTFAISAWLSSPIKRLAETMKSLAGGDLTVAIEGVERQDEIGLMSGAVQVFKDNGLRARQVEREAAAARQTAADAEARGAGERAARAAEQAVVVESLAAGLQRLSAGDLLFRVDATFARDYEQLRADFNNAMAKLQDTMKVVAGNTSGIRTGSSEISTAADDLSRRTERQAASLEETAAALNEIMATVRKTSQGTTHARDVVQAAKEGAAQSSVIVRQAVDAMATIAQSSSKIGQIIGVIDEIAFQTNLLALNAGVEAARAGEAGRGFAVVASEVRALAQRSAEAAKEIKALISASGLQVADGVQLVDRAGKALAQIAEQVAEITGIVSEIAASADDQATALQQVNVAITQLDQVTQQNAAMVEESTAASRNLYQETEGLARIIGVFKIGGEPVKVPAIAESAHRARSSQVAVPALKVTGRGGAARAAAAAIETDWTEF